MDIRNYLSYGKITLQLNDFPEADGVCAAFALYSYFTENNVETSVIYGGTAPIASFATDDVLALLERLKINLVWQINPISFGNDELLITVDCQYGTPGTARFDAANFAVIDRHYSEIEQNDNVLINSSFASTSTVVWHLLQNANAQTSENIDVCNAIFYGLYSASNRLAEYSHPFDRDIIESIPHTGKFINQLNELSLGNTDLKIIGNALSSVRDIGNIRIFHAGANAPRGTLAYINEMIQSVSKPPCSVVYSMGRRGLEISVRSNIHEIMASELLEAVTKSKGSLNGDNKKAGGTLRIKEFAFELYGDYNDITPEKYLLKQLDDYINRCDLIYCDNHTIDFSSFELYVKTPVPVGYAKTAEIFALGTPITIRTLEGDVDTEVSNDTFIMVGAYGEVYPIKSKRFNNTYKAIDGDYDITTTYEPVVINRDTSERRILKPHVHLCIPSGDKRVRAQIIKKRVKVFTSWDKTRYFKGIPGDYLAAGDGEHNDCYIIRGDIFLKTYESIKRSGVQKLYDLMNRYEEDAYTDKLTGLQNRNSYLSRIQNFCVPKNLPLGIVNGDVNYLKRINDTIGHKGGDRLLKVVANVITDTMPFGTFAARTGGDELVLLFPGGGETAAKHFIDNVCKALAETRDDLIGEPSVSWGWAVMDSPEQDYEEVFKLSDERMYEDKKRRKAQRTD